MENLIPVNYDSEQPTVSARDLHEGLGIKSKYADWFKNMSAYGFTENIDYTTFSKNLENGGRIIEHIISVDMAKQICMIQRSEDVYKRQVLFFPGSRTVIFLFTFCYIDNNKSISYNIFNKRTDD